VSVWISPEKIETAGNVSQLSRDIDTALRGGGRRRMRIPQRHVVVAEDDRAFVSMPAMSDRDRLYVNKVGTVFPRPPGDQRPQVSAVVVAFSSVTGEPIATLDGVALTNLKCAAVSALVTDYCARPQAVSVAILGAGVQARQQVRAVGAVRDVREIRVWARNPSKRRAFVEELRWSHPGARVAEHESVESAVEGADVVGTATASSTPLSHFGSLSAHAHVNCMGGHTVDSRELPVEVLTGSLLIVEDVETAVAEAGPVHRDALELEALPKMDRAELWQRRSIFSSTGHAFLDVLATAHVLRALGVTLPGAG